MARAKPARKAASGSRSSRGNSRGATQPGRAGRYSRSALRGLGRFSRPRSVTESLVLILAVLGIISCAVGLFTHLMGRDENPVYWGALLLIAAGIGRLGFFWERFPRPDSFHQVRIWFGVGLIFVVLVLITADFAGHALGSSTIPLLGPFSTPWLAYSLMALVLLAGICSLAVGTRAMEWLGLSVGAATQVKVPRVTKVTRETRIDSGMGTVVDSGEQAAGVEYVRELLRTPLVEGGGRAVEEPEEDEEDAAPPPKPPKKGRQAGLPMLPPIDLFTKPAKGSIAPIDLEAKAATIEAKLASFGVGARVVGHRVGPTVTLFDVEPDPGVKVKRITELQNDLALALAAPTIRIQAPVPGRPVVGIEIPNSTSTLVTMREVLESDAYHAISSPLRVAMGKDVSGGAVCIDLARMPHLLVAGATGSGKSSLINVIICGLLYQNRPEDVRLIMIDPKMVELSVYNKVPHLYLPVVTDMDKVLGVLRWTLREMERRYALFRDSGARNLTRFNQMLDQRGEKRLPFIVVVIDELADLMMVAPDDVEACVIRLAQLARATGIHLVIATQRPSVDVVTGLIKANFPARIAFAMSSQVDSRTILDQVGAEKLLGRGDMLYQDPSAPRPVRLQGAYLSDREIERLVDFWNNLEMPTEQVAEEEIEAQAAEEEAQLDPLFDQAKEVVRQFKHASISLLQRRLSVGYQRASRLMDQLENQGVVATAEDGKSRRVLPVEEGEAEAEPRESI